MGNSINIIKESKEALIEDAKIGLEVKAQKTHCILMPHVCDQLKVITHIKRSTCSLDRRKHEMHT